MGLRLWALQAARAADSGLGRETVVIDVGDVLSVTDLFVITSGINRRQVRAIVQDIEQLLAIAGGPKPISVEGSVGRDDESQWVLMDYAGFVVHVFDDETRDYYDLEKLWADRPKIEFREVG